MRTIMGSELIVHRFNSYVNEIKRKNYKRVVIANKSRGRYSVANLRADSKDGDTFLIGIGDASEEVQTDLYINKKQAGIEGADCPKILYNAKKFTQQYRMWDRTRDMDKWNKRNSIFHLNSPLIAALYFAHRINCDHVILVNTDPQSLLERSFDKKMLRQFIVKYVKKTSRRISATVDLKKSLKNSKDINWLKGDPNWQTSDIYDDVEINFDLDSQEVFSNFHIPYDFDAITSCAIVGNSGNLKGSGYGDEIDSYECVVRFNAAPISGFENDVGTKRGIRFINNLLSRGDRLRHTDTEYDWIDSIENERIVFKATQRSDIVSITKRTANKNEIYFLSDHMADLINDFQSKYRLGDLSLGFRSLLIMSNFTDEIGLFGFGFYREDRKNLHYWEEFDSSYKNNTSHNWAVEQKIIDSLDKRNKIELYK